MSVNYNEISVHPAAEENPGFLLWQVSTLWSGSTTAALKSLGLTHPQLIILANIEWLKGASKEEIGSRVVMDFKVLSHLLRSLQIKGLIEPSTDERNQILRLTTAGTKILAKALPVVTGADAAFFSSIDLKNSKMILALQTLAHANLSKNKGESCSY